MCIEISIDSSNMAKCEIFSYNRSKHVYWNFHRSSINMVKFKMFSYNRSGHVYWNFHRSSINMAKYDMFSYNRSRHEHGIFHRSASNLVKCDMIIYRFWLRYLYGNSANTFVKFSAKSLSNVYIFFSISKACICFSIYISLYIS